jgi:hypothetical protein
LIIIKTDRSITQKQIAAMQRIKAVHRVMLGDVDIGGRKVKTVDEVEAFGVEQA